FISSILVASISFQADKVSYSFNISLIFKPSKLKSSIINIFIIFPPKDILFYIILNFLHIKYDFNYTTYFPHIILLLLQFLQNIMLYYKICISYNIALFTTYIQFL